MKILLRIFKVGLAIGCIILLLYACGFGRNPISTWQVEKIELTGWNKDGTSTVELNENDVRKFIMRLNLSKTVGQVAAERCERTFSICVHMKDGRRIYIMDHDDERMKVTGFSDQSIWIANSLLLETIKNLVHDYGLVWQSWGC